MDRLQSFLSTTSTSTSTSTTSSTSSSLNLYSSILFAILAISISIYSMFNLLNNKKLELKAKTILITGGSQGLGLALAILLSSKGSNTIIAARDESKLKSAIQKVKAASIHQSQSHSYISSDVSTFKGAKTLLESCPTTPEIVFCCAGGAKPGFFLNQDEEDFQSGLKTVYWTALSTSHAAANAMVKSGIQGGKIVLVSSTLGYMGLIGYSQYAPMKHAIRGLADSLRSELLLYNISVHAYFPGTILSPGLEEENKTKPKITQEIEGKVEALSGEDCAKGLLRGVEKNQFHITTDFDTELFRVAMKGAAPGNGILDIFKGLIAAIGIPLWRMFSADPPIVKHRQEHYRELGLELPDSGSSKIKSTQEPHLDSQTFSSKSDTQHVDSNRMEENQTPNVKSDLNRHENQPNSGHLQTPSRDEDSQSSSDSESFAFLGPPPTRKNMGLVRILARELSQGGAQHSNAASAQKDAESSKAKST